MMTGGSGRLRGSLPSGLWMVDGGMLHVSNPALQGLHSSSTYSGIPSVGSKVLDTADTTIHPHSSNTLPDHPVLLPLGNGAIY